MAMEHSVFTAILQPNLYLLNILIAAEVNFNIRRDDLDQNSPLHLVVQDNTTSEAILNLLLTAKDIDINITNTYGQTPLFVAARERNFEAVKILIERGADVNKSCIEDASVAQIKHEQFLRHYLTLNRQQRRAFVTLTDNFSGESPLHVAVGCPNIVHLLIIHGANLEAVDFLKNTPLFSAVRIGNLETVCMLLYYNANANHVNRKGHNPFLSALIHNNEEIIDTLFEYTTNFKIISEDHEDPLGMAISNNSRYASLIADKYKKTNTEHLRGSVYFIRPFNEQLFKNIWDKYVPDDKMPYHHIFGLQFEAQIYNNIFNYILDSPKRQLFLGYFYNFPDFHLRIFIKNFCKFHCSIEILEKIIFLLLEDSFVLSIQDIYEIFVGYGYCDLIKLLRYVTYTGRINDRMDGTPSRLLFNMIFNIHSDIKALQLDFWSRLPSKEALFGNLQFRLEMAFYISRWADREALTICQWPYPVDDVSPLPKLTELARDKTRQFIIQTLNISSTSQFYTVIDHLNFSLKFKKILNFERPLYFYDFHFSEMKEGE